MPSRFEAIVGVFDEIIILAIIILAILWGLTIIEVISMTTAIVVGIVGTLSLVFLALMILRPQLQKPSIGIETYIGKKARAVTELRLNGLVSIEGEYWSAASLEPVGEGEHVEVVDVKGPKLTVRRPKD